jgi:dCTP deaminase
VIILGILTKEEMLQEMKNGNIKISPFNRKNLGPASYDLTLGNEFRVFNNSTKLIDVNENTDYTKISSTKHCNSIVLQPGDFILGITKERIKLSGRFCGWLSGRTRFARLGIGVHVTADFVQPGVDNKQVLEIKNLGTSQLKLNAGTKLLQIMFEGMKGKPEEEKGKFAKQMKI